MWGGRLHHLVICNRGMCINLGTEGVQYCSLFVALLIFILHVLLTACIINCFSPDFVKSMKVEQFSPESGSEPCFAVCLCRHLSAASICCEGRVGGRNMWWWQQPQAECCSVLMGLQSQETWWGVPHSKVADIWMQLPFAVLVLHGKQSE